MQFGEYIIKVRTRVVKTLRENVFLRRKMQKGGLQFSLCINSLKAKKTLAGVAQWVEHWPENQRVAGSIPSQGT